MRRLTADFIARSAVLVLSCGAFATGVGNAAERTLRVGMPLAAALEQLRLEGVALVYSSVVVTPDMTVRVAVTAKDLRGRLADLLDPHGLGIVEGPGGTLIVVQRRRSGPPKEQSPPEQKQLTVEAEITVEPSSPTLLGDDPAPPMGLEQSDIRERPRLADDVFRALDDLPGIATGDVSAKLHVRGGRRDEMLVLLDGQELFEPYHLRDFDSPLSIVDSSTLDRVSLLTGAFPVTYGDRVAGVLDMTTRPPSGRRMTISMSLVGAQLDASDTYLNGRLGWIASGRRGSTDLIGRAFDAEDPRFWDFSGKASYEISARHSARANVLVSRDSLHFAESEIVRRIDTDYDSSYLWLTQQSLFSPWLYLHTIVSASLLKQDRGGSERDAQRAFEVHDDRQTEVRGLTQSWGVKVGQRNFVTAGIEYRRFDSRYDYASDREFFGRNGSTRRTFALDQRFVTRNAGIYASNRFDPFEKLTLDLGLRYDSQTAMDGDLLSPRLSAAWAVGPAHVLRVAWGRYSQSHRPHELMVEDGDARFYPAEKSEQWALGYEQTFSPTLRLPLASLTAEAYMRHSRNPRPRHENLFESFHPFPEGIPFRVRIEPDSATARGFELLLRGRGTARWNWRLNYALADTNDEVGGERFRRLVDQTHSVNAGVGLRPSPGWSVNLTWLYHTGWPITPVTLETMDGELVPVVGRLNSSRGRDYNRVDLRISRDFRTRTGMLTLFIDAQNLMNHGNQAGIDLAIGENGQYEIREERWPGFLASAGFVWRLERIRGD